MSKEASGRSEVGGVGLHDADGDTEGRCPRRGRPQHRRADVGDRQVGDAAGEVRQVRARADADLQGAAGRPLGDPPPGGGEQAGLQEGRGPVVPGGLPVPVLGPRHAHGAPGCHRSARTPLRCGHVPRGRPWTTCPTSCGCTGSCTRRTHPPTTRPPCSSGSSRPPGCTCSCSTSRRERRRDDVPQRHPEPDARRLAVRGRRERRGRREAARHRARQGGDGGHAGGRLGGGLLQGDAPDRLPQPGDPRLHRSCGLSGDEKTAYVARPPQD